MASAQNFQFQAPSTLQPLASIFPQPIVAKRAPTANDINYNIGQEWVYPATNSIYFLSSVVANVANWQNIAGGAGVFTSLTVNPGPTNLSTVGNGAVTVGNAANTGAITFNVGTGNYAVNGGGNSIAIGNDAAANTIAVGSTTNGATTDIFGGNGTGIGSPAVLVQSAAAGDIQVGAVGQTGVLYLGTSTTTGTINVGGTGAGTGAIGIGVNSGARTINIGVNAAGVKTINVGTGAVANVITIGSSTAGNITTLASPITALPGPVYVYTGAGAPGNGLALHVGDLYINTTAASATTRMYIATGVGAWTNITCAA